MSDQQRKIYQSEGDRYEALASREDYQGNIPRAVDEIINVDEEKIKRAVRDLIDQEQMIVEASGAATIAALEQVESVPHGSRVAAVISGGNLDPRLLREVLTL